MSFYVIYKAKVICIKTGDDRSLRGHDCRLTQQVDLGNWRLLIPSPVPETYVPPTRSTSLVTDQDKLH